MDVKRFEISEVCLLRPHQHEDDRGWFAEIYNQDLLNRVLGTELSIVQDNVNRSTRVGTVRALHLQNPPNAQGKLVRVTRGSIRDVAVDVRKGSPTYGGHVAVELRADRLELFWVPPGFAHGFVTLAPETEVSFKTTAYYSPADEVGIAWNDPELGIDWGVSEAEAILSERDRMLPLFAALRSQF